MGNIKSTVGNITRGVDAFSSGKITLVKSKIESLIGNTTASLSNIWSGGFTGMSESGMLELKDALSKYCDEIQAKIDSFDQTGDITSAFKGRIQEGMYDFIDATKLLLQSYVSTMRVEIDEAEEAYKNFAGSDLSISQDIQSAAQDIRSNASSIRLD